MITDAIDKLDKKVEKTIQSLTVEIKQIKDDFRSTSSSDHMLHRDMVSFKNDLDAIKGLLLNRLVPLSTFRLIIQLNLRIFQKTILQPSGATIHSSMAIAIAAQHRSW